MKISLENAVKAISEYLTEEFSKMPKDFNDAWMNAGMHIMAEYTLQPKGQRCCPRWTADPVILMLTFWMV